MPLHVQQANILKYPTSCAIERLGAVQEGVLRNERQLPNGYVRDAVVYSIIASEWPVIKEQLLQKLAAYK